jgi:hypothetical protein
MVLVWTSLRRAPTNFTYLGEEQEEQEEEGEQEEEEQEEQEGEQGEEEEEQGDAEVKKKEMQK